MIQLQIDSESDLYNPYDPSRKRIDEGVYQYLKSYFTPLEASRQTHDTLQIITDSAIDTEKFQSALQDAVDGDFVKRHRRSACDCSGQGAPGDHFVSWFDVSGRCCQD